MIDEMIGRRKMVFIFMLIWLLVSSGSTSENKLKEVMIWTPDDGVNHHYSFEGYKHYTSITHYPFISVNTKHLNISSRSYGGDCYKRFVLFSVAKDLMSPDYYEIFIGLTAQFRKTNDSSEDWDSYGVVPTNCDEFRDFTITWTDNGSFSVYNDYSGETAHWTDTLSPVLNIQGVGIKTGFGDEGMWKFKHYGTFDGYFCIRDQTYGNMDLLGRTTAGDLECAAKCSRTNDCLGMNYNSRTKACELLKSGQPVLMTSSADWFLSTKCLDGQKLCQACM